MSGSRTSIFCPPDAPRPLSTPPASSSSTRSAASPPHDDARSGPDGGATGLYYVLVGGKGKERAREVREDSARAGDENYGRAEREGSEREGSEGGSARDRTTTYTPSDQGADELAPPPKKRRTATRWTAREEARLRSAVAQHGRLWSAVVGGLREDGVVRSESAVAQHWAIMEEREAVDGSDYKRNERRHWTREEDVRLLALSQLGTATATPSTRPVVDWTGAAPSFPGRRRHDLQGRLADLKGRVKRDEGKKAIKSEIEKLVAKEVERLKKDGVGGPSTARAGDQSAHATSGREDVSAPPAARASTAASASAAPFVALGASNSYISTPHGKYSYGFPPQPHNQYPFPYSYPYSPPYSFAYPPFAAPPAHPAALPLASTSAPLPVPGFALPSLPTFAPVQPQAPPPKPTKKRKRPALARTARAEGRALLRRVRGVLAGEEAMESDGEGGGGAVEDTSEGARNGRGGGGDAGGGGERGA
ncbi:hypothetical protein JCM10449v2_007757 [Rhodotorula kratochvilovae]